MLDLGLLRSFVAVVDGGGFRAAARRLGVSQPLLTQRLHRLAEALGSAAPPMRVARAMGSTEGVKRAVAAGLGVPVLLACAARDELAAGSLLRVPLAGTALRRRISMVLPAKLPPQAPTRLFRDRLRAAGQARAGAASPRHRTSGYRSYLSSADSAGDGVQRTETARLS